MHKLSIQKFEIFASILALICVSLACNMPDVEKAVTAPEDKIAENMVDEAFHSDCSEADRSQYEQAIATLGGEPETPKYPEGATYYVCYGADGLYRAYMVDGPELEDPELTESDDEANIPVGTYAGKSNFHSTLENDVDDSFAEPICQENTITVAVESDGTTTGELRSICQANAREGASSIHNDVTGIINGNLTDTQGQCIVSYTWRSYNDGPQCTPDTPCRDETVNFDFLYNVNVSGDMMTFTPVGDVDDYYSFELIK
jgi:hypothetical protein